MTITETARSSQTVDLQHFLALMPHFPRSVPPFASESMDMSSEPPTSAPGGTSPDDASDIDGVVRRDQSALARIYGRLGGVVYGMCRQVLHDDGLAQDVAQEIFLRLWNEPKRFDAQRGSLRSFLLREARSRSIEKVRSEEARTQRETRSEFRDRPIAPNAERDALQSLTSDAVRTALLQLPEVERSAIVLAYYGGHSYREVATALETPEGTIKSRIRSGLSKLSSLLTVDGLEVEP